MTDELVVAAGTTITLGEVEPVGDVVPLAALAITVEVGSVAD